MFRAMQPSGPSRWGEKYSSTNTFSMKTASGCLCCSGCCMCHQRHTCLLWLLASSKEHLHLASNVADELG
jgi:hypothetical protein